MRNRAHGPRIEALAFLLALVLASGMLAGCAPAPVVHEPAPVPVPQPVIVTAPPVQPRPPAPVEPLAPVPSAVDEALAYADRIRAMLPAELVAENARLSETGDQPAALLRAAMALAQTRTPANGQRAQGLLQRLLGQNTPEAQALHPLARWLTAHVSDLRRADEPLERQAQQLRDAQRRIEQLNERLEALRAIERSLPSRSGGSPAPANGQRP